MKKILNIVAVLACAATLSCGASGTGPDWEPLFNGTNLDGWQLLNGKADFKVVNGEIVGTTKMGEPGSFLATTRNYGDFIMEFEVYLDDGVNSGVQLRSLSDPSYKDGKVHGYQFELEAVPGKWSGGIYDENRRGWLYPLTYNPDAIGVLKTGEWNTARIEAVGPSIRTWINGTECSNLLDDMTTVGFIALQVHSIRSPEQAGRVVKWRDLRICTSDIDKHRTPENRSITEVNNLSNVLSGRETAEGWELLWDGKTTAGWRGAKFDHFPTEGWSIEDGLLKVWKGDGSESENGGDIVTLDTYRNFILKVDFKITKGANSGIKYFVDPTINKGPGSAIGCEFQILDDDNHPDAKLGVNGNRTLGSLYDLIAPSRGTGYFFDKNNFNTAMVIVQGDHVEHWLNGVKIVEYDRNTQMFNALVAYSKYRDWPNFGNHAEGHILLQDHGDEVHFRNVKIKQLP